LSTRMETYTGRLVDLSRPNPADISIEDIAWHLSRIPRFGGATNTENVYTVAQHSVLVLNRVKQTSDQPDHVLLLTALLHDAHEAYIGDIIRPMSNLLDLRAPILRLKQRLQKAVYVGLLGKKFEPYVGSLVDEADTWACNYEAYHLMHSKGKTWTEPVLLDDEYILRNVIVWPTDYANDAFKNHFQELMPTACKQ
jgi:5'-nucleotidase